MEFKFDINAPTKENQVRFYVVGEGEYYSQRAENIWKMFNYEVKYDFGKVISFKENGYEVSRDIFDVEKPPSIYVVVDNGKPQVKTYSSDYNHELLSRAHIIILERFYEKFRWKLPSNQNRKIF